MKTYEVFRFFAFICLMSEVILSVSAIRYGYEHLALPIQCLAVSMLFNSTIAVAFRPERKRGNDSVKVPDVITPYALAANIVKLMQETHSWRIGRGTAIHTIVNEEAKLLVCSNGNVYKWEPGIDYQYSRLYYFDEPSRKLIHNHYPAARKLVEATKSLS